MAHRERIGVRAKAILRPFWKEDEVEPVLQAIDLEAWMDVLQDCSHTEIRDAWSDYIKDQKNRTKFGNLKRPDPGKLYHSIMAKRPRPKVKVDAEPERGPRVTKEQADKIMNDFNMPNVFAPKRFGGKRKEQ